MKLRKKSVLERGIVIVIFWSGKIFYMVGEELSIFVIWVVWDMVRELVDEER